jgi:hypothetical protein
MLLFTGYFAKIKFYRDAHLKPISIANQDPPWEKSQQRFIPLVPGNWIYSWKRDLHNRSDLGKAKIEYINTYFTKCLNSFTPQKLYEAIAEFTEDEDAILLCYETPPNQMGADGIVDLSWLTAGKSFCHRHLIADFLRRGGYNCIEYAVGKEPEKEGGLYENI